MTNSTSPEGCSTKAADAKVELERCPFCGETDAFSERADFSSSHIVCNNCLARGPTECQEGDDEDEPGRDAAIRAWNTRVLEVADTRQDGEQGSGASLRDQATQASPGAATASPPSGECPSRKPCDMDRAFEIALRTLHLSDAVTADARLFYADALNNREGHVSERVAARIIAATFAATEALREERRLVYRWLSEMSVNVALMSTGVAAAMIYNDKEHVPAAPQEDAHDEG